VPVEAVDDLRGTLAALMSGAVDSRDAGSAWADSKV
jgi:hypothetical protein